MEEVVGLGNVQKYMWPRPTVKEIARAAKLGFELEGSGPLYSFDVVCQSGPWWGTHWNGCFDLERQICSFSEHPRHPHVTSSELCVSDLPDNTLITWVQALLTLWHETNWEDAWKLEKCVEDMIEGLDRDETASEPDMLAEFRWIKRALKECNKYDERINYYRELIRDLCKKV